MTSRGRKPVYLCPPRHELSRLVSIDPRPSTIARLYGVPYKTVMRWFVEAGIPYEPRRPASERHPGWAVVGYRIKGDRSSKVVPALYTAWVNLRRRCTTDSPIYYRWYKAKGIKVCAEWNDYATFRAWALANGFRKGLQIDRADGSLGYEPANCRWVTRDVQQANRTFKPRPHKPKAVKWYPGAKGKAPRWYVAQLLIPC